MLRPRPASRTTHTLPHKKAPDVRKNIRGRCIPPDRAGPDRTEPDWAGLSQTGPDWAAMDRAAQQAQTGAISVTARPPLPSKPV